MNILPLCSIPFLLNLSVEQHTTGLFANKDNKTTQGTEVQSNESSQLEVQWKDRDGRTFYLLVPDGIFRYSILSNDEIEYEKYGDYRGRVTKVGPVKIEYEEYGDYRGRVTKVGSVRIEYERYGVLKGYVVKVGGLNIEYEEHGQYTGRFIKTTGDVN